MQLLFSYGINNAQFYIYFYFSLILKQKEKFVKISFFHIRRQFDKFVTF